MKVSVLLSTYNHEKWIAQAIESVLIQETNFDYEVVIMEDCSTDSTRDIVVDFQRRCPEKIRLILSEKNKCDNTNFATAWQTSLSQYVATLDGDDYWTSPHKLQKQVDLLDADPECSICFHNVRVFYEDEIRSQRNFNTDVQKEISTVEDLWKYNFIAGCSGMLRKGMFSEFPDWYLGSIWGDWPLYILNAQHGKIIYIDEVMGAYRIHSGGFWSGLSQTRKLEELIEFYEKMNANLNFSYNDIISNVVPGYRKELALAKAKAAGTKARLEWHERGLDYYQFIRRIEEVARTVLPPDATVIIVGNDDDGGALDLDSRRVWHLPEMREGGPEKLFAGGAKGTQEAPWIADDKAYEFRLYAGTERKKLLTSVKVKRGDEALPAATSDQDAQSTSGEAFITAKPNPVAAGVGPGTTTISWRTGEEGSWGQVYVSVVNDKADHYPVDGAEAIAQLEELRERGAEFLLLPETAFWWLEHYPEFKEHLESRYRKVAHREDAGLIIALREAETDQKDRSGR